MESFNNDSHFSWVTSWVLNGFEITIPLTISEIFLMLFEKQTCKIIKIQNGDNIFKIF